MHANVNNRIAILLGNKEIDKWWKYVSAEDGDKGGELAKLWESSIRQALMPVVHVTGPQGSVSSVKVHWIKNYKDSYHIFSFQTCNTSVNDLWNEI